MINNKVLICGDFSEVHSIELIEMLVNEFGADIDILATGYNIYLLKQNKISEKNRITDINADLVLYYKNTAPITIITSCACLYKKTKRNQKLIYYTNNLVLDSFYGAALVSCVT